MNHHAEFRRCLIDLDVVGICELWFHVAPGLPQPRTNEEALFALHHARTQAVSIPENLRCYSHSWLLERRLPSALPDELRPKADRLYPRVVEAVGISVSSLSRLGIPLAEAMERAMSDAVAECYADGVRDPAVIKARLAEVQQRMGALK